MRTATKPKPTEPPTLYSEYRKANERALKRGQALMSGKPDPGPLMTLEDDGREDQPSGEPPAAGTLGKLTRGPQLRRRAEAVGLDDSTHPTATDDAHLAATHGRELVPIEHLAASPFQPRRDFDSGKLDELAASLKADGINRTDLIVRLTTGSAMVQRATNGKKSAKYEILAGERRWRAAAIAKLPAVWCVVVEVDDAAARRLCRQENLQREDLTDIERVTAYRDMLTDGDYSTQQALAEALGITPATLSNQLRVLELPKEWLDLVSQEKLTLTHLRCLVPWQGHSRVLAEAMRAVTSEDSGDRQYDDWGLSPRSQRPPTVVEFEGLVLEAVKQMSRPVDAKDLRYQEFVRDFDHKRIKIDMADLPLPGSIKQDNGTLKVIDVKGLGRRAFNIDVWNSLSEHAKARRMGTPARPDEDDGSAKKKSGKNAQPTKVSAAELREKAKVAAEQFARRLARYRLAWLQDVIVERLAEASAATLLTHVLMFAASDNHASHRREQEFGEAVISCGGSQKAKRKAYSRTDVWSSLNTLADSGDGLDLPSLVRSSLTSWYQHDFDQSSTDTSPDFLEGAAAHLSIDFAAEWRLDREFLELLTKEQLVEQWKEWKLPLAKLNLETAKRSAMIDAIIEHFDAANEKLKPNCPLPKSLAKLKRP